VTHPSDDAPHQLVLDFEYDDAALARLVERSIAREVGEIEGDRTSARLSRDGTTVRVRVAADDLVALRAGLNTWCTLLEVAERVASDPATG